jgi:uncharacterized protein (DUF302 family)
MSSASYGFTREFPNTDFDQLVDRTIAALKDQGFGVLTDIDVKDTLKKKLDVDVSRYRILGACNPKLAHLAMQAERFLGLLLPCNVVVMEGEDGGNLVSAIDPAAMFSMVDNDALQPVADQVGQKLKTVIDNI